MLIGSVRQYGPLYFWCWLGSWLCLTSCLLILVFVELPLHPLGGTVLGGVMDVVALGGALQPEAATGLISLVIFFTYLKVLGLVG